MDIELLLTTPGLEGENFCPADFTILSDVSVSTSR